LQSARDLHSEWVNVLISFSFGTILYFHVVNSRQRFYVCFRPLDCFHLRCSLSFVSVTEMLILNCLLPASHRQLARNSVAWFSFRDASLRGQHPSSLSSSGLPASYLQQFYNENFNPSYWLAQLLQGDQNYGYGSWNDTRLSFVARNQHFEEPFKQGDQKVSVKLMITIQKVTSNVQSVPPPVSKHLLTRRTVFSKTVFSISRSTFRMCSVMAIFDSSVVWGLMCIVIVRCTDTF
jgi:hypothetical protein